MDDKKCVLDEVCFDIWKGLHKTTNATQLGAYAYNKTQVVRDEFSAIVSAVLMDLHSILK